MFWRVVAFGAALVSAIVASNTGNVAVCYVPDHLEEYQDGENGDVNVPELQSAIDKDFKIMSQNFTHVRTYNSLYFGASPVKAAAVAGIKLYLGVQLRMYRWQAEEEVAAAVQAVKDYPGTVEAIVVSDGYLRSDEVTVLDLVNDIKKKLGAFARNVKFGTSQTVGTYLDDEDTTAQLVQELDFLGVSIMPYETRIDGTNRAIVPLDPVNPMTRVQRQWDEMKAKFPSVKLHLTKTGFPADPSEEDLIAYYKALKAWEPAGSESPLKFWYRAFDRHSEAWRVATRDDPQGGFYTYDGKVKVPGIGLPAAISEPVVVSPSVFDQCASGIFALRADTGNYVSRCDSKSCAHGSSPSTIAINAATYVNHKEAQWRIRHLDGGKIALQADKGLHMARCSVCRSHPDIVFALVRYPRQSLLAQWEVLRLPNGKYAFRVDPDHYMARCYGCVAGGEAHILYAHETSPAQMFAQFDVTCV
ncbi:TPA: hypothetical protein N0F65_000906 [Lagenidium giganteum]|uniref:glucan endo-1,3-beta-D-glucosidase n=1 Tax=Lagenidium giganteum TaxID=4803 RepID=A0AAV2YH69_9STRA|nr:TPA: hypothetical protein N0F65_000906 [Lagenidium giganteum]